jgi:hypothetical protein
MKRHEVLVAGKGNPVVQRAGAGVVDLEIVDIKSSLGRCLGQNGERQQQKNAEIQERKAAMRGAHGVIRPCGNRPVIGRLW